MSEKRRLPIYEREMLARTVELLTKVAEVDPSIANKRRMTNAAIELYKVAMCFNYKQATANKETEGEDS